MKLRLLCCLVLMFDATAYGTAGERTVPEIKLKDLGGHEQRLSGLRGKVVVLSFWATWCGPCKEELPRLAKLKESYSGKAVRFVAVSIDEAKDRGKITPFLNRFPERQKIDLEVWTGASTETMARLGLGDIVPSTIIVDERGYAITRITGEARDEDVISRVDWLLSGRLGEAPAAALKRY